MRAALQQSPVIHLQAKTGIRKLRQTGMAGTGVP
jgi:hypothetical protein